MAGSAGHKGVLRVRTYMNHQQWGGLIPPKKTYLLSKLLEGDKVHLSTMARDIILGDVREEVDC